MKHRLHHVFDFSLILLTILLISGCASAPPNLTSESAPNSSSRLPITESAIVVEVEQTPVVLDPMNATNDVDRAIAWLPYDSLVTIGEDGQLHSNIADWKVIRIDDQTARVDFRLRSGLRFHDESQLLAQYVITALKESWGTQSKGTSDCPGITPTATPRATAPEEGKLSLFIPLTPECTDTQSCAEAYLRAFTQYPISKPGSPNIGTGKYRFVGIMGSNRYVFKDPTTNESIILDRRLPLQDVYEDCGPGCQERPTPVSQRPCPTPTPTPTR